MGLASWFAERNGIAVPPPSHPLGIDQVQERATVSIGDPAVLAVFGIDAANGSVGETTAMNLSGVYRAVSLVAGAIGSLPLRTLTPGEDGQWSRTISFLDRPGGDRYTPAEWAELVMVHLLLHGNAYLQHIYAGAGQLVALYPVHPGVVTTEWDDSRPGGKVIKVSGMNSRGEPYAEEFDALTMTQVMGPSLDGLVGISALHVGRLSLGTGVAGERAANQQFKSGAMISGLVTPADQEQDMTPDQANDVRDALRQYVTGPSNAGKVAVMSKALKFSPWTMTATDAQFMESRLFSVDEIGRWFGVPPHLLGLTEKSTSWGQGIAEQNRGLARYTLQPWTNRIEQRVSLLLSAGRRAEFDYAQFVRPAPEDEIQLLIAQVNSGLLTLNEARAIRNLRPVTGGDAIRTPAGAAPPTAPAGSNPQEAP